MDRPPWELYLIEGLDAVEGVPPGGFAILLKMHHAAVDGVAGTEILNALHDHTPDPGPTDVPADDWRPDSRPSELGLVGRAAAHAVVDPVGTVRRLLWPTLRSAPRSTLRAVRSPEARGQTLAPVTATRFNRRVGAHRVWDARRFLLEDAKQIKRAVPGASINDVALAWIGGALRGYLGEHGELPESSLVALMPISLRATTIQPHGGTEVSASRGGNRFAMANIPMGTDVEDPLERVAAVQTRTQTAKEYALDARAWSSGRRPCPARWPARLSGRSSGWPIARAARWACT